MSAGHTQAGEEQHGEIGGNSRKNLTDAKESYSPKEQLLKIHSAGQDHKRQG